jgi:hypothetical protein
MLMMMSPDFPGCGVSQMDLMPHPGSVHHTCDCTKMIASFLLLSGSEQANRKNGREVTETNGEFSLLSSPNLFGFSQGH